MHFSKFGKENIETNNIPKNVLLDSAKINNIKFNKTNNNNNKSNNDLVPSFCNLIIIEQSEAFSVQRAHEKVDSVNISSSLNYDALSCDLKEILLNESLLISASKKASNERLLINKEKEEKDNFDKIHAPYTKRYDVMDLWSM